MADLFTHVRLTSTCDSHWALTQFWTVTSSGWSKVLGSFMLECVQWFLLHRRQKLTSGYLWWNEISGLLVKSRLQLIIITSFTDFISALRTLIWSTHSCRWGRAHRSVCTCTWSSRSLWVWRPRGDEPPAASRVESRRSSSSAGAASPSQTSRGSAREESQMVNQLIVIPSFLPSCFLQVSCHMMTHGSESDCLEELSENVCACGVRAELKHLPLSHCDENGIKEDVN